ncbi:hypothetical protein LFM09_24530 [Lentzea alba]|uniref:hypothetical protein n=1 Tax=Lentzea alba TaxID=2714351 RepID=UPI0039BFC171
MNDDFDDELRRLFSDDRLDVQVTSDATDAVVRGADRRRRRRNAVTATFALVALVGAGVGLSQLRPPSDDTAGPLLPTSSSTASATPPPSASTYTSTVTVTVDPPTAGTGTPNPPGGNTTPKSSSKSSTAKPPPPTPEAAPPVWSKLSLGMSYDDAMATGELGNAGAGTNENCRYHGLKPGNGYVDVYISLITGIVRINLPDSGKTSKGIGAGSTVADAKAAYPTATQNGSQLVVPVIGTPQWKYVFETNGTNVTAVYMRVAADDQCL